MKRPVCDKAVAPPERKAAWTEYHCPECGRLLFKSDASAGVVQTPCPKCRAIRTVPVRLDGRAPGP